MKSWIRLGLFLAVLVLGAGASPIKPELKVIRPKGAAHPQEPYLVTCVVSWSGSAGLSVLPAKIGSIDWGAVKVEKAVASAQGGIFRVEQSVVITPAKAGDFKTPEILIPYRNPEDLTPSEASAPATNPIAPSVDPTLRADPFILHVRPDRTLAWVSGGLGALLLCFGLGWRFARKRRSPTGHLPLPSNVPTSEHAALHDARQFRLDGKPYEFYLSLNRAISVCPGETDLIKRIRERAQAVGYQGAVPTDAQMTTDYQEVERILARRPHEEARPA
jgi:hypothetical protein